MTGPFEMEADARAAVPPAPERNTDAANYRILADAVGAAGVRTGAFDDEVLRGLAQMDAEVCVVIAGLIARAAEPR